MRLPSFAAPEIFVEYDCASYAKLGACGIIGRDGTLWAGGTVGIGQTVAAMRNYISAFLDANLKGGPVDPLLRGPSADYPDVEVTSQTASPCTNPQNSAQR